jgi:hypothetical protein
LKAHADELVEILLVSEVNVEKITGPSQIEVTPATGTKCARCWLIKRDVNAETGLCERCASAIGTPQSGQ